MNRVSKLVKTGTTYERTIYIDGIFEYCILENGTTYEKNEIHIMDDKSRIAMVRVGTPFPDDIVDAFTYNLEDQIGSSSVRLNTYGTVIDREEYYPYGDSSLRTFTKKRYRYVGKEKDLESGLYYYGARYYLAWTCRFISVDPLAHDYPFYTPYNYAGNKPINRVDIDGLQENGASTAPTEKKSEQGPFISTENSGINPDVHAVETSKGIKYSFKLGEQQFDNISMVEIGGKQYFDLGKHMYYGDNGWSVAGDEANRITQWPNRPVFEDMWTNLPKSNVNASNLIGGKVKWNFDNNPKKFSNTCAIRMSRALNYSDAIVTPTTEEKEKGRAGTGADKMWYYYGVTELDKYINNNLGQPDLSLDVTNTQSASDIKKKMQGKVGIIMFKVSGWTDAVGHFDMWDGSNAKNASYFNPQNATLKGVSIWFLDKQR